MPRTARQKSSTEIYHLILRGVNRQQIFYDEEDYESFIGTLYRFREVSHFSLYAYCLMGNHVHLLIKASEEPLETVFRRIGAAYVYWYNLKYQRVGHLFQDRYKSEPVENDGYFLAVLRYILRNPVKAGLCASPAEYPYSNARELVSGDSHQLPCDLTVPELAEFIERDDPAAECLEMSDAPRRGVTESAAKELIRKEFGTLSPVITHENRKEAEASVRRLAGEGLSIRQLSRLTGISKSLIERALK